VCSYGKTPSPGLTRLYFGDGAAARVANGNDAIFKPTPAQSCDTQVAACYDVSGANVELTRQRFGEAAAKRLDERSSKPGAGAGIDRYGETITCDNLSQVCYDRLGAGYFLTKLYLGDEPAERLLARLRATSN
jgi:hypothetical protein